MAITSAAGCGCGCGGDGDRLSSLSDGVIGHILSFLPAKEAARAAVLSSRWRHTFAAVHTVSLVEPDAPVVDHDEFAGYSPGWGPPPNPNPPPPPFASAVSAALLARHRRAAAVPLRALRVSMAGYAHRVSPAVDQWIAYAVNQPAPDGVELDLRLGRPSLCHRDYSLRRRSAAAIDEDARPRRWRTMPPEDILFESPSSGEEDHADDEDDDDVLSDDGKKDPMAVYRRRFEPQEYSVPRGLFACAALRSLSLGSVRLALPAAAIALPSLETLLLADVTESDHERSMQRLISGCPRLADLTLEACYAKAHALSVAGLRRLRRLALRCCHGLDTVVLGDDDASPPSELQAFEYRGEVPDDFFLVTTTKHGHGVSLETVTVAYCKIDICGDEVTSRSELAMLGAFLRRFAGVEHLHLASARLGSGLHDAAAFATLPDLSTLRRLELGGCLPDDDDDDGTIFAALIRLLDLAPNLEALSLVFHPEPLDDGDDDDGYRAYCYHKEEELHDKHLLRYNRHSVLAAPTSGAAMVAPACLRRRVREINLVHYQGGTVQRALAMYLLRSAAVIRELRCELAMGPLWIQDELVREIKGWVMNKAAVINFG
ncbi:F-box protein At4g22280-like [Oryza sativa Japonica Group]|uniref:F-box domain containing protein n=2 Tax=Oryza sativa subsp. japonica TaxID=39947 RepID=Q2R342_ORYSJ|nr:F-box domain containing protein [Oryza sativa Japonica Group]USI00326.1 F-box domain and LRR containing protein [Oryza sativa Japonica Group]BAH95308.1 Os11g0538600 [Oryza sativa Japonica Group]BAT14321.1 Os11g0538600 [Oryza sativa Japonica Group]|eukprot:NP_001176580.1 Os11g0538600 [Oryza sativa Japonica Group]